MKDAVDRIDKAVKIAADKAEVAADMATATKDSLDAHVEQAAAATTQGAKDKAAILERQDRQDQTIATLAHAVDVAAQSTPPSEEH
jgi:K+-transporting ATPase c subunit